MKRFIVAASLLVAATPAFAQPAPAGKCSLIDGGVRLVAPPGEQDLRPLATPLPKGIGDTIADVSFDLLADGSVSNVKVLCVTTTPGAGAIVVNTVKGWKFAALSQAKKAEPLKIAYRVSAAGVIPLSFVPNPQIKKLEG